MRVLVVSKQPDQHAAAWLKLSSKGVDLAFAASQAQAEREVEQGRPSAIIVDGRSVGSRRQRICSALRRCAPQASIFLIDNGASDAPEDRAIDLRLQPPLEWQALTLLLQKPRKAQDVIVSGPFRLCLGSQTLAGPFGERRLTPVLTDLMACLMRHPGEVLTRPMLMQEVWKTTYVGDTRTLDVHVSWMRKIIEPDSSEPVYILTRRGAGYVFVPEG